LFSQLKEINFFQTEVEPITRLMIAIADDSARQYAMAMASRFRQTGVNTEIFWEDQRLGKKLKYAERLGIPYVAIIGGNEVENKTLTLKTMATHIQSSVDFKQALQIITTQLH
jgi:histidyl-tRNA synthetase